MRIGFVSFWFTRGQAYVTREMRRICREGGHDTFVLARPDKLKKRVRTDGIWAEDGVEVASDWDIPTEELLAWAERLRLDVCFFFHNQQFDSVRALRETGVRTVGTWMWENFHEGWGPLSAAAYDSVYCMTNVQTGHFAEHGVVAPRIHWGCWPELDDLAARRKPKAPGDPVTFYYPAGYLEIRRAIPATVAGFLKAKAPNARLLVKSTKPVPAKEQVKHPQVIYHAEDVDRAAYLELLGSCDVTLSNTRWEGLGLVLYESIALGMPIICPDFPPMNEVVRDGLTGLVVPCSTRKRAPSGVPAADCRPRDIAKAVRRLSDRAEVARMGANALSLKDLDFAWDRTRGDLLRLVDRVGVSRTSDTP